MESPDDLNDFASSDPSTSEEPSLKRRRQNEIGDTEVTTMGKFYFTFVWIDSVFRQSFGCKLSVC